MNDRKRQVLLTAQRLFVENGFSTTSIQDILKESGISKGTFYNYFTSKNECMMAILEQIHDIATIKRRELLLENDASDKNILVEQIFIRMLVNREQNLLPIYEAIFYSGDAELRDYIRKHLLGEVAWISGRLIDVYGDEATPYAPDCAVIMLGMMQHFLHFTIASTKNEFHTRKMIQFTMRRIDAVMANMIDTKDSLLENDILLSLNYPTVDKDNLKQQLVSQLEGFLCYLQVEQKQNGIQFTQFLLEEIRSEKPRAFLLETVSRSFRETFRETRHHQEAIEISSRLLKYIDLNEAHSN